MSTSVSVSWSGVSGAESYAVEVSSTGSFGTATNVFDAFALPSTTTLEPISNLGNAITYYWRVGAKDAEGHESGWAGAWSFTIPAAPGAVMLLMPGDGKQDVSLNPTLSWSAAAGPLSGYEVRVSTDLAFGSTIIDETQGSGTDVVWSDITTWYLLLESSGYKRRRHDVERNRSFSIPYPPGETDISSPSNDAINQPINLMLQWNYVDGAESYAVEVSTVPGFTTTLYSDTTADTLQVMSGIFANFTTYYWRVNTLGAGGASGWTSTWSFTTIIGAPAPALPSNNAVGQATTLNLTWNSLAGVTSYGVQVSGATDFGSTIYNNNISGTSATISGLANDAVYYWRVNATASGATGAWSNVNSFTTIVGVPTLVLPSNGAVGRTFPLAMSWGTVAGATSYDLQVSTDVALGVRLRTRARLPPHGFGKRSCQQYGLLLAGRRHEER